MDGDTETLPVEGPETPGPALDEATWLDDVARYFQDDRPDPRRPDEFSRSDWENHRNHTNMQAAQRELEILTRRGVLTRRMGNINGRRGWLYRFVK